MYKVIDLSKYCETKKLEEILNKYEQEGWEFHSIAYITDSADHVSAIFRKRSN